MGAPSALLIPPSLSVAALLSCCGLPKQTDQTSAKAMVSRVKRFVGDELCSIFASGEDQPAIVKRKPTRR